MNKISKEEAFLNAKKLLGQGKAQDALELLKPFPIETLNAEEIVFLSRVQAQINGLESGISVIQNAAKNRPATAEFYKAEIELLLESGKYAEARTVASNAKAIFKDTPLFFCLEIDALELMNQILDAETLLQEALKKFPGSTELLERNDRISALVLSKKKTLAEIHQIKQEIDFKAPIIPTDKEFVEKFTKQFAGREGVFAVQCRTKTGEWGYNPVRSTLDEKLIKQHLSGDVTFGTYLVRKDNSSLMMVFDLDIAKPYVKYFEKDPLEKRRINKLFEQEISRFFKLAADLGIPFLLEFSGFKGYHFWAFSEEPIQAKYWRAIGKWMLDELKSPPVELHWELFPKQDVVPQDGLGNLVKIPLGVHRRNNIRSYFVSPETLKPFSDQKHAFMTHPRISIDSIKEILGRLTIQNVISETKSAASGSKQLTASETPSDLHSSKIISQSANAVQPITLKIKIPLPKRFPPDIENLFAGCQTLWTILEKAVSKRQLTHTEKHVLTFVLSVLGDDGRVTLHQILSQLPDYNPDQTNQAIRAVSPTPISCAKIRKLLPDISKKSNCKCQFRLPSDCYPSPVVFANLLPSHPGKVAVDRGADKVPVILSNEESFAGESGGIDKLMHEYLTLQEEIHKLLNRERILRFRINQIFENHGTEVIKTELGEYRRLPLPENSEFISQNFVSVKQEK